MKKIILVLVFVFANNVLVNASTSKLTFVDDCAEAAWRYGTKMAGGIYDNNEYVQWYFTNQFYEDYCVD